MSGQFGEPDWANAGPKASAPVTDTGAVTNNASSGWASSGAGVAGNANVAGMGNVSSKTNWFQYVLSIFSMGLAAMMCCLGVFGIIDQETSALDIASIFVSVYMILFSVLLFLYELMWWKSIDTVNKNLRLNFGFLYGVKGKALYLIFVAFLVIGLKDDVSVKFLRYLTGGSFLGTGALMLFVHFTKPELLSSYQAPTAGFGDNVNNPV